MKKILPILGLLAACAPKECPPYDVTQIDNINGKDIYEIRITLPYTEKDQGITGADIAAIQDSRTCEGGFQDILIAYDAILADNTNQKRIRFYCI